jgi:hypothetical protein
MALRRDGRVVDGGGLENVQDRLSQDGYISVGKLATESPEFGPKSRMFDRA